MTNSQAITVSLRQHAENITALAASLDLKRKDAATLSADVLCVANSIGSAVTIAQAEIAKAHSPFSVWEWIENSVAGMDVELAKRCVKVFRREITDPRQMLLTIALPQTTDEQQHAARPKIEEDAWVIAARGVQKMITAARAVAIDEWPERQRCILRSSLEPVAKALWPERFTGPSGPM
jgi:hypothetical protein